jgi:hypothetical protein
MPKLGRELHEFKYADALKKRVVNKSYKIIIDLHLY